MDQTTGSVEQPEHPRTTSREEAIARFGSHWDYDSLSSVAYESLGHADPELSFQLASREDVIAKARASRHRSATESVASREGLLGRRSTKVLNWLARHGLHPKSARILENVGRYQKEIEEQKAILDQVDSWEPTFEHLPDELILPTALEPGRSIWKVDFSWPLENGIRLTETRVASRHISRRLRVTPRGIWDYEFQYTSEDGKHSFKYNYVDQSNPEVDNVHYMGVRIFLTRAAAEQCIREIASLMKSKADDALAAL